MEDKTQISRLVLTLDKNNHVMIGDDIKLYFQKNRGRQTSIVFEVPRNVLIKRVKANKDEKI